jgi:hypothetical protein
MTSLEQMKAKLVTPLVMDMSWINKPDYHKTLEALVEATYNARTQEVVEIVKGMCKEFVPADMEWFGKEDYSEGEYKLVPAKDPKDAMYCLSCERFLHEEGCICGFIYKDNLIIALSPEVKDDGK